MTLDRPLAKHALLLALLLPAAALAGCAGGGDPDADTDGDGLPDGVEELPRAVSVTGRDGATTRQVTSDPGLRDTDDDGLEDFDEHIRGTDPRSIDTDGDRLLDGPNVTLDAGDERVAAWRALGILESPPLTFLGELSFCPPQKLKPDQWSSDRPFSDQLGDGEELLGWNVTLRGQTRHVVGDPCTSDADNDGAQDHVEREMGTDPRVADTDGDGAVDGFDADPLADLRVRLTDIRVSGVEGDVVLRVFDSTVRVPANGSAELLVDVPDTTADRSRADIPVLLIAEDAGDGGGVALFPGGAGATATFELVGGTLVLDGATIEGRELTVRGADGSLRFAWDVARV